MARVAGQRRFNTLSLLDYYMGPGQLHKDDIAWTPSDPNVLRMTLPGMGFPPCRLLPEAAKLLALAVSHSRCECDRPN